MGDPALWHGKETQRLRRAQVRGRGELPAAWLPAIDAEARRARPAWGGRVGHPSAQAEVWGSWLDGFGGAYASDLSDSQIKATAAAYALEARAMDLGDLDHRTVAGLGAPRWGVSRDALSDNGAAWCEFVRVLEFCRSRDVDPPPVRLLLKGMASRVRCPYWWRRALRRMVARRCERGAMALGLVSKPAGQPYASNSAVWRRVDQNRRNAQAAANIYFENDEGKAATLAELSARSVSNKAIRRGELMTRIRGCEEIADECGHVGLFLTATLPSRFHSTLHDGRRNPRYQLGLTPRDGQEWLCNLWARARSKLARLGVPVYGFRVAEPHHDGCAHWHALLWVETEAGADEVERVVRGYWLSDDGRWNSPSVPEPGALKYRVSFKRMHKGGAAGYVAKYVAKNIDDHGLGEHVDGYGGETMSIAPDLLGDLEIKPSLRVEAWAATWGIRQFQPIGQPPVGVWRELRRVKESEARAAGFQGIVHRAWCAAQRVGGVQADWARYVKAQGGLMRGRRCHIRVRSERYEVDGLYGRAERLVPVGVALNIRGSRTVWSNRRLWRPIESSEAAASRASDFAAQRAAPWTRVNNCTAAVEADAVKMDFLRGQGGQSTGVDPPCDASSSPRVSGRPPKPPTRTP